MDEKKVVLGPGAKCCGEGCGVCAPEETEAVFELSDELAAELELEEGDE
jgi:hypothetical protein